MFASQLLRILQTLPVHENSETCAFDTGKPNPIMMENQNEVLNGHGRDADPFAMEINNKDDFWSIPELECSIVEDNSICADENESKDSVTQCIIPAEMFEKGSDFYTDKSVMECELPELIVCYKESMDHVVNVKDICVDEGVPSENKNLIDNFSDDHEGLLTSLPSSENKHSDITMESVDTGFLIKDEFKFSSGKDCDHDSAKEAEADMQIPDGLKTSSEIDVDQDVAYEYDRNGLKSSSESDSDKDVNECDPGDLMQTGEAICNAADKIIDDPMREELVANSMLSVKELCTQTSFKSMLESSSYGGNDVGQQPGQISCVEAIPENASLVLEAEDLNKNPANNLSYNSNVETGAITFNFSSCEPAAIISDTSPENVVEQPPKSSNVPIHDDGFSGDLSVTNQVQRGEGESSFAMAGPVSGPISYSGAIPYSGSVSLRSDSSTTSTRSFAFPVLQSEWNSSPVRMAKGDRRQFRKHKGWKQGVLCCKF